MSKMLCHFNHNGETFFEKVRQAVKPKIFCRENGGWLSAEAHN